MRYQFTKTVMADNRNGETISFAAGTVVNEIDLLPGCFENCLKHGRLVPITETPVASVPQAAAKKDNTPVPQRSTGVATKG